MSKDEPRTTKGGEPVRAFIEEVTPVHADRFMRLLQRFHDRGAHIRAGCSREDMIEHLLDAVENLERKS